MSNFRSVGKRVGLYAVLAAYLAFLWVHSRLPEAPFPFSDETVTIEVEVERRVQNEYYVQAIAQTAENVRVLLKSDDLIVSAGEKWRLTGTYHVFQTPNLTKAFDEKKYWNAKGVTYAFEIAEAKDNTRLRAANPLAKLPDAFKSAVRDALQPLDPESQNLIYRVVTGESLEAVSSVQEAMRDLGVAHLLAASGMHVDVLFGVGLFLLVQMGFSRRLAEGTLFFTLFSYAALIGFPASIFRATSMRLLRSYCMHRRYRYDPKKALAFSLLLLLIVRPYALGDVGLQLSYVASAGILFARRMVELSGEKRAVIQSFLFSFWLQIFLLPVMLFGFGEVPVIAFAANVVVIPFFTPLFTAAVGTLLLAAFRWALLPALANALFFPPFTQFFAGVKRVLSQMLTILFEALDLVLKLFFAMVAGISALPVGKWSVSPAWLPLTGTIATLFIAALLVYARWPLTRAQSRRLGWGMSYGISWWRTWATPSTALHRKRLWRYARFVTIAGFLLWSLVSFVAPPFADLGIDIAKGPVLATLTMLDVGQGDSLLLESAGKTALFDTGGQFDWRTGENPLAAPYVVHIKQMGIRAFDAIFLSHADYDHIGNLTEIMAAFPVESIYRSPGRPSATDISALQPVAKDTYAIGDVLVEVLRPGVWRSDEGNDDSMVLRLSIGEHTVLLTGDLEASEVELIGNKGVADLDVLKVAHHGSSGGTSAAFVDWVQPEIALIGVGADNAYGHPTTRVLRELARVGTTVYRTDISGDITLAFREKGIEITTQKKPPAPIWWRETSAFLWMLSLGTASIFLLSIKVQWLFLRADRQGNANGDEIN